MKTLQDKIVAGAATVIAIALGFIWNTVNDSKDRLIEIGVKSHICEQDLLDAQKEFYRLNERLHKAELDLTLLKRP